MNCFYTHPLLKFTIYSIFILPNFWFYIRKFKANRIDIQKILIINCLTKQRIFYYLNNKLFDVHNNNDEYSKLNLISEGKAEPSLNLENENELEKFLDDYYNNAIYGDFFNLKI